MVPHHLQYGKLACMTAFTLLNITENPVISMHMQYAPKVFKGIYIIDFFLIPTRLLGACEFLCHSYKAL